MVQSSSRSFHDSKKGQELVVVFNFEGAAVKFNEWVAQKKTIGERCAVSAFGDSPSSLRNSSFVKDSKSASKSFVFLS